MDVVEEYLAELKELVRLGWYDIDLERDKNSSFINKYHLRNKDIQEILLSLESQDYVEDIATQDFRYNSERLYIFKKKVLLDNVEVDDDEEEEIEVRVYVKTSIPEGEKNYKTMIVVSFHEDEEKESV